MNPILGMLTNWRVLAALGAAFLVAMVWLQTHRLHAAQAAYSSEKASFSAFREQVRVIGEASAKVAKEKEAKYAKNVASAIAGRDAARKQLRDFQSSAGSSYLPRDTAGSICYDSAGLDAALRTFGTAVEGLVREGEEAGIDLKMTLEAWPK